VWHVRLTVIRHLHHPSTLGLAGVGREKKLMVAPQVSDPWPVARHIQHYQPWIRMTLSVGHEVLRSVVRHRKGGLVGPLRTVDDRH
jgi:hypothetical protein